MAFESNLHAYTSTPPADRAGVEFATSLPAVRTPPPETFLAESGSAILARSPVPARRHAVPLVVNGEISHPQRLELGVVR